MKLNVLSRSILFLAILLAACSPTNATLPAPQVNVAQATATSSASACGAISAEATATTGAGITLIDGLGRTVTLAAPAQRVVSLAPSNTEILFAVSAGGQVVGRDPYSDYPAEAATVTDIGDTYAELNTELITSLQPDLVLAAEITPPEQVAQLEQLGITVYWLANPVDLSGLYNNLNIVAQLTGHETEAAALVASLCARVEAVQTALAGIADKPTVFYEVDGLTDPNAPYTAGTSTFIDLIITAAGGVNAAATLDGYKQLSIEELLVQNPDFILLGDAAYGATPELVAQRAGWTDLAAVQKNQVIPFDDNLMSRPGPRLVDGLEQLAKLLHPEQFN
jgi:iron complex transport system substrate-binding protein